MTAGLFASIDPRAWGAGLAMLATAVALIAWQQRGDPARAGAWLGYGALFVELLAASMALAWAFRQGAGPLTLVFGLGFVGLALSKATTAGVVIANYRERNTAGAAVGAATLIGVYTIVYLAGAFEGSLHTAETTAHAAGQSAPIQAIDAQLQAARERLANLAGYADPSKADAETAQAHAEAQAHAARLAELRAALDQAQAEAAPYANPDCSPKTDARGQPYTSRAAAACARIQAAQASIEREQPTGAHAGGYAARHAEYLGLRAHVADLETRRAGMLATGGAAQAQAAGADDRLIGWAFGLDTAQAAGLKWLLFVLGFDLLSLGLRMTSELQRGGGAMELTRRRLNAMLAAGIDPTTAAALLAGTTTPAALPPPAQVQRPEPLPALDTGGRVLSDGGAVLHSGEAVLNAHATAALDTLYPGLIDALNAGRAAQSVTDTQSVNTQSVTDTQSVTTQCVTTQASGKGLQVVECKHCGKPFKQRTLWHSYCNADCKAQAHGFTDENHAKQAANRKRAGNRKA
jgi:hypothetical protein